MAAPFVQGQLRKEYLSVEIETSCKHCGRPMHLTVDSNMRASGVDDGASPLVFTPDVSWDTFTGRTIIDFY